MVAPCLLLRACVVREEAAAGTDAAQRLLISKRARCISLHTAAASTICRVLHTLTSLLHHLVSRIVWSDPYMWSNLGRSSRLSRRMKTPSKSHGL